MPPAVRSPSRGSQGCCPARPRSVASAAPVIGAVLPSGSKGPPRGRSSTAGSALTGSTFTGDGATPSRLANAAASISRRISLPDRSPIRSMTTRPSVRFKSKELPAADIPGRTAFAGRALRHAVAESDTARHQHERDHEHAGQRPAGGYRPHPAGCHRSGSDDDEGHAIPTSAMALLKRVLSTETTLARVGCANV